MANTNAPKGFRPFGAGHLLISVTLSATATKGDACALVSGKVTPFVRTTHGDVYCIVLESGVADDVVLAALVAGGALFEVQTALTFAVATHVGKTYDITGATGAQQVGTTQTYGNVLLHGWRPDSPAHPSVGEYANVLVSFQTVIGNAAVLRGTLPLRRIYAGTLTGAFTVPDISPPVYLLDPGGASRNVTLPAAVDGLSFLFVNKADAAENLVIKDAAANTIATAGQNESVEVFTDGTTWYAHGISQATV